MNWLKWIGALSAGSIIINLAFWLLFPSAPAWAAYASCALWGLVCHVPLPWEAGT